MQVEPYLTFEGRCDEAIEFYKKALAAEVVMLMRFKDAPQPQTGDCKPDPAMANKVMHSTLRIGETMVHMSDGQGKGPAKFSGIMLSVKVSDDAQAAKAFSALGDGGNVVMPLGKTFFSSSFGMLTDRFGVMWMVIVQH